MGPKTVWFAQWFKFGTSREEAAAIAAEIAKET
jgi:hypothetical protein